MKKLASFATQMRAYSLEEELFKYSIEAQVIVQPWKNKKLPPPRVEVYVRDNDFDTAAKLYESFRTGN